MLALIAYLSAGLENLRTFLGERSTKYGASTILASVFFIGIVAAVNYIGARYDHRWDVTEGGVYSLSPQSLQVVEGLPNDLQMQAFVEQTSRVAHRLPPPQRFDGALGEEEGEDDHAHEVDQATGVDFPPHHCAEVLGQ